MAKAILGIDIGHNELKLALVKDGRVKKTVCEEMPENLFKGGRIVSIETMGELLRKTLRKNHIRAKYAALALVGDDVHVRNLSMPQMNEKQLTYNLPYEFRDYIRGELKDYYFDYAMRSTPEELAKTEKDETTGEDVRVPMRLLGVAVPKVLVEDYRAILRKAGLKLAICAPYQYSFSTLVREYERRVRAYEAARAKMSPKARAKDDAKRKKEKETFEAIRQKQLNEIALIKQKEEQEKEKKRLKEEAKNKKKNNKKDEAIDTPTVAEEGFSNDEIIGTNNDVEIETSLETTEMLENVESMVETPTDITTEESMEDVANTTDEEKNLSDENEEKTKICNEYAFLDIGYSMVKFLVLNHEEYETERLLDIGTKDIDKSIAEAYHVDEHLAHTYLVTNYDNCQKKPCSVDVYNRITTEIIRSINFYRFSNSERELTDLRVCGGGADIDELIQVIKSSLDIQVHNIEDIIDSKKPIADINLYTVAIGSTKT